MEREGRGEDRLLSAKPSLRQAQNRDADYKHGCKDRQHVPTGEPGGSAARGRADLEPQGRHSCKEVEVASYPSSTARRDRGRSGGQRGGRGAAEKDCREEAPGWGRLRPSQRWRKGARRERRR